MPLLKTPKSEVCDYELPCVKRSCAKCQAEDILTADDWQLVLFYRRVSGEYVNQCPGSPTPILTPRLEGYAVALKIYGYPRVLWHWLIDGGTLLHRLIHKQEDFDFQAEIPRLRGQINAFSKVTFEDVRDS